MLSRLVTGARAAHCQRLATALPWLAFAVVLVAAPLLWTGALAQTLLAQMGIAIIAGLAYNILFGQGGLTSFGHAVYSGVGAFAAIHALRSIGAGGMVLPVALLPLVGGAAGWALAALLGPITTRRGGTAFAMITLGTAELIAALALALPTLSGGESGLSADRVVGPRVAGVDFAAPLAVYYLIAAYCGLCTVAMYALTRTPLGLMLRAARDQPDRVGFVGYDAARVRYLAFMISGFFAGVAGGLAALNFEHVGSEVVGAARSAALLMFTVIGGAGFFAGPIIGGVLMVLALGLLSTWTRAWLLYLGVGFIALVMLAPQGIAGMLAGARGGAAAGGNWIARATLAATAAVGVAGAVALVEMAYQLQLERATGSRLRVLGVMLDTAAADSWVGAAWLLLAGAGLSIWLWRQAWPGAAR